MSAPSEYALAERRERMLSKRRQLAARQKKLSPLLGISPLPAAQKSRNAKLDLGFGKQGEQAKSSKQELLTSSAPSRVHNDQTDAAVAHSEETESVEHYIVDRNTDQNPLSRGGSEDEKRLSRSSSSRKSNAWEDTKHDRIRPRNPSSSASERSTAPTRPSVETDIDVTRFGRDSSLTASEVPGVTRHNNVPDQASVNSMRAWATTPVLRGTVLQCRILRTKSKRMSHLKRLGGAGLVRESLLQLQLVLDVRSSKSSPEMRQRGGEVIMCAQKQRGNRTSNFHIAVFDSQSVPLGGVNCFDKHSMRYIGKVRSNFLGTEFRVFDDGSNPDRSVPSPDSRKPSHLCRVRRELAVVLYEKNILGSRGPRKMTVLMPQLGIDGKPLIFRPTAASESVLLSHFHESKDRLLSRSIHEDALPKDDSLEVSKDRANMTYGDDEPIQVLHNRKPQWSEAVGAFVLNFNGRVTEASVKNFQLERLTSRSGASAKRTSRVDVDSGHFDENNRYDGTEGTRQPPVLLQFGRCGADEFALDVGWPFTPLQAFGIAITSLESKLACE